MRTRAARCGLSRCPFERRDRRTARSLVHHRERMMKAARRFGQSQCGNLLYCFDIHDRGALRSRKVTMYNVARSLGAAVLLALAAPAASLAAELDDLEEIGFGYPSSAVHETVVVHPHPVVREIAVI